MSCLPLCRSAGTGAGDMLFGYWFPPHVAMSMVPVMAHGDVQRDRRCILLKTNMEITSDHVIDFYFFCLFIFVYIV